MSSPHWLAGGTLWYVTDIGQDNGNGVLVESDGKIQRFATRCQLQAALGPAIRLDIPIRPNENPELTVQTRRPVTLHVHNPSLEAIQLWWLAPDARSISYGKMPAGRHHRQQHIQDMAGM